MNLYIRNCEIDCQNCLMLYILQFTLEPNVDFIDMSDFRLHET